jgi:outer membrane protein assembly factor BamB
MLPFAALTVSLLCASAGAQEADPPGRSAWPIFRGDAGLSGVSATELPRELELHWTYEAGGPITSSPVLAGGVVYFGSDDQKLHAVDAATGAAKWSFKTEDFIEAPPFVASGTVFIGSNDGHVYALDAVTGELRWKKPTLDKILASANFVQLEAGPAIVIGSYDASLYCLDAKTGEQRWVYTTDNYVNGTAAIDAGRAIFGGCDAILHVVDLAKGERASALELGGDCHIAGSIAFVDGRAYFGHYGNAFVCVDVAKNEIVWSYTSQDQAFFSSPAITQDRVVFGGRDRNLHCVKRDTGESIWKFKTRRKVDGSPVVAGDKVIFGSGDGRVYLLALADGAELWSQDLGQPILSSPAVVAGKVYIGANDGLLYCFGAPRPKETAVKPGTPQAGGGDGR